VNNLDEANKQHSLHGTAALTTWQSFRQSGAPVLRILGRSGARPQKMKLSTWPHFADYIFLSVPAVPQGNPGSVDVIIGIAAEDFQKLIENPKVNSMQLFFSGKMKLAGNPILAQKLGQLFSL
jgi:hypothetical protein